MNVLQVIPAVAPCYGGPSTAALAECRALECAGIHSALATTDADGSGRLPVAHGEWLDHDGVRSIFFRRRGGEALKWSPAFARWCRDRVHDFDIVHIRGVLSHVCLAAAAVCRRTGVPYVLEPLGTLDRWSLDQKSFKKQALLAAAGRRTIAGAAAVRCTSHREAQEIAESFAPRAMVTIPLGVDIPDIVRTSTRENAAPYLLSLSRLHPVKRIEQLIDGFAGATRSATSASWRLIIAGDGEPEYVASLQAYAAGTDAARRISFTGWVSGSDRERLLAEASMFALLSHHENFGLSLAEALAAGVPALVSRGVHLADDIASSGAGWIAGAHTADITAALAAALDETLSPTTRDARRRAARGVAAQFAWPTVVGQLRSLYTNMASSAAAATPPLPGMHGSQPAGRV
jgi:glycosyltransferase involved in cell wall biosynthesis